MNKTFKWAPIVTALLIALVMTAGYAVVSAQGPPPTPPAPYSNP